MTETFISVAALGEIKAAGSSTRRLINSGVRRSIQNAGDAQTLASPNRRPSPAWASFFAGYQRTELPDGPPTRKLSEVAWPQWREIVPDTGSSTFPRRNLAVLGGGTFNFSTALPNSSKNEHARMPSSSSKHLTSCLGGGNGGPGQAAPSSRLRSAYGAGHLLPGGRNSGDGDQPLN